MPAPAARPMFALASLALLGATLGAAALWPQLPLATRDTVPTASGGAAFLQAPFAAPAEAGAYACPPGGASPAGGGVCARAFGGPLDYLVEPDLAVSPRDARVMAIAANDAQSVGASAPLLAGASQQVQTQRLAVFVTSDGGATWTRVELPVAPPPLAPLTGVVVMDVQFWDPTISFDATGVLHVAGVLVWQGVDGSAKQKHVFHVATSDLGASWSAYTLLGAKVDRPWMTIEGGGAIDIAWWETGDTSLGFARSIDGGAHWSQLDPGAAHIGCYFPSPPVEQGGAVLVACPLDYRFVADPTQHKTNIYRYDPPSNAFALVGAASPSSIAFLFPSPDGALVLAGGAVDAPRIGGDIMVARSVDGGATWTDLPDLGASLRAADSWWFLQFMGGRIDPWGNLDLFVRGLTIVGHPDLGAASPYVDLPAFLGSAYADEFAVAHVVLDPTSGAVRSEQLLTPAIPHAPASASAGAGDGRAGDYYGVGFAEGHAVLAWEYQRSVYMTTCTP